METNVKERINDIDLQILQLTQLQHLCIKLKEIKNDTQDNAELLDLLKKKYTLTKDEISTITSMVEGKKKVEVVEDNDLKKLENKFNSYCLICEINPNTRDGTFMGYTQFSNKCSNKKSILNKKLAELKKIDVLG